MSLKVIQWATGEVGRQCLQEVIRRPNLDLAGLLVYSAGKDGVDAGIIAGGEPVGLLATRDRDAILATEADCVIYTPLAADLAQLDDDVVALLSSGKNVVTSAGYFAPISRGAAVRDRLEAACRAGNSTLFGTGIEPGFMFDRVAPTLSGMCAEIDHIRLVEISNASLHPAVVMLKDAIGIGQEPDAFHAGTPYGIYWAAFFSEMVTSVARAMGVTLDRIETGLEVAVAEADIHIPALGIVPAGRINGALHRATGIVKGEPFISAEIYWFVGEQAADWPTPTDRYSWIIEIEGRPSMRTRLDPFPSLRRPDQTQPDPAFAGTMATLVNAIPSVVAAEPGILHASVFAPWSPAG